VQLNDYLGGMSIHHREVQGHESEKFLSLFDMKITYTQGGVQSGFKHVEKGYKDPRLYHIKDGAGGIRVDLVSLDRVSVLTR
jgi:hypothetical protein